MLNIKNIESVNDYVISFNGVNYSFSYASKTRVEYVIEIRMLNLPYGYLHIEREASRVYGSSNTTTTAFKVTLESNGRANHNTIFTDLLYSSRLCDKDRFFTSMVKVLNKYYVLYPNGKQYV